MPHNKVKWGIAKHAYDRNFTINKSKKLKLGGNVMYFCTNFHY